MKCFKKIVVYFDAAIQRSLANSSHQLVAVGALLFFGFPLFYWVWSVWFPQPYESLWFRLVGSVLGLGLMLTPFWPIKIKAYLSWYWFFSIVYSLPFFFGYLFLMNHASIVSSMTLLCSLFVLVLLVDFISLSFLLILGWGAAIIVYYVIALDTYIGNEHLEIILIALFVIIASSTVNYKTALLQQQRLAEMAAAASMIAHELRTPLLGIKSGAQALATYSPILFNAYHIAKEKGFLSTSIRDSRLQQLERVSERIISEIDYANSIIDMLLIKAGRENSLRDCVLELCEMSECLSEAMARYPFQSASARALVHWEGNFQFMGAKLLMQHVLFNLLKNALYMIATTQRGEIRIWTESKEAYNFLYVQDTAQGMTKLQLSRLFDHFYTTTFMGTGIGLSFCKLVMKRFGGDIRCEAQPGRHPYTKFILSFPRVMKKNGLSKDG